MKTSFRRNLFLIGTLLSLLAFPTVILFGGAHAWSRRYVPLKHGDPPLPENEAIQSFLWSFSGCVLLGLTIGSAGVYCYWNYKKSLVQEK